MTFEPQSKLMLQVDSPEAGYLNVRSQPTTSSAIVTKILHGARVTALEPEATVRAKVGQYGQWLHVRLDDADAASPREAYAAAWYLKLAETTETGADTTPPSQPTLRVWVNSPEVGYLNIRKAPSISSAIVTKVQHNTSLTALEAEADVRAKLGQQGQWLKVRLPDGAVHPTEGYAAAPYLSLVGASTPDSSLEPPAEEQISVTASLKGAERQVALTWNRLGGLLRTLADQLAIDPGVAVAVLTVESGGRPFGPDGRMIIRFENHVFHDQWGNRNPDVFARHFTFDPNQRWKNHQWRPSAGQAWRDFHGEQSSEWQVFDFACTLDGAAAKSSISMGGPQIMGFNYAALGYASVQHMFDAFAASERDQVVGFFNFVRSRSEKAVRALQSSDFEGFAKIYNGAGQAAAYGRLIRETYQAYQRLRTVSFGVPFGAPPDVKPALLVEVDDLKRIMGIGPKTAAILKAEGIYSFARLAALDAEHLRGLLGNAAGRARWLETWPVQARLASWSDWDALTTFQAQLKS